MIKRIGVGILGGLSLFSFAEGSAWAWDKHAVLMPQILNGLSQESRASLLQEVPAPCEDQDRETLQKLVNELLLNPKSVLPATTPQSESCGPHSTIRPLDILQMGVVDDPDRGIDQDLPETLDHRYDPNEDRKWMGGTTGSTSQGFRHMYFGGWKVRHPISTFQVPPRPVGQALERTQIIAIRAKEMIKNGQVAWGFRLLGWAMHYVQDLAQPFHSAQILSLRLVPWDSLWAWPPSEAFENLRKETTRVVTNLHWAYEGYSLYQLEKVDASPFRACLTEPEKWSKLPFDPVTQSPRELAAMIARQSIELAPRLGATEIDYFGAPLMKKGVDYTKNPEMIDFREVSTRPDLEKERVQLHQVTCQALANAALGTRALIQWALQP